MYYDNRDRTSPTKPEDGQNARARRGNGNKKPCGKDKVFSTSSYRLEQSAKLARNWRRGAQSF